MYLWKFIKETISDLGMNIPLFGLLRGPAENSVGFTIAIIALSAKMAKVDGAVTRDEVRILRQVFDFNEADEENIARVFDLARQDTAGYREYAKKIRKLFVGRPDMLDEVFEGLVQIATADGKIHENEEVFLREVLAIFQIREYFYDELQVKYFPKNGTNPYEILGVHPSSSMDEIRSAYRKIVRENHPDSARARGLTAEAIAHAENRIRAANSAFELLENK